MKKLATASIAIAASLIALGAHAEIGKAASDASDAAKHKMEQQRAESKAKESGPVGKAVNDVKAEYHGKQAERQTENAKKELKKSTQ